MVGLIFCLLSLVFFFFPIDVIAPALSPYRIQILIIVPGVAISLATLAVGSSKIQKPQMALMIGLWFAICMSFLSKLKFHGALYSFTDFLVPLSTYLLVALNVTTAARIRAVCITIFLCTLTLAVLVILAFHTGYMSEELIWTHLGEGLMMFRRGRAFGTLNDPNDFAQVLVAGIGLSGMFWRKQRTPLNLILLAPPTAVMIYAIYLTGSRGAIFGLAMLAFVVISKRLGPMQSTLLAGTTALLMVVANFGAGRSITMHEERVTAWGTGITLLKSHPLFGVGYGKFGDYLDITAHNSFVLCFAELGLFGYFFWLGLITVSVLYLQRMVKLPVQSADDAKAAALVNPLRAAMYGYLVTAWFLSRTYNPMFYVLVALVGALTELRRQNAPTPISNPAKWVPKTIAVQFASVVLIYLAIRVRAF